jgi:phage baseplate assembly protein gpV
VLAGVMTRNEGREEEGYDPIDGLDEPLQPVNMMSLEQAEAAANQPPGKQPQQPAGPGDDAGANQVTQRMALLLQGNAGRLARRFAKDGSLVAALVAEAMAVPESDARAWCAVNRSGAAEEDIAASLMQLAGDFNGALPPAPPVINVTTPPVSVHVAPPAVTVEGPTVHVAAPNVTVAPPNLNVTLPPADPHIEVPVAISAHVHDTRTVTKTIVTQRHDDGTLTATVKEEPNGPA